MGDTRFKAGYFLLDIGDRGIGGDRGLLDGSLVRQKLFLEVAELVGASDGLLLFAEDAVPLGLDLGELVQVPLDRRVLDGRLGVLQERGGERRGEERRGAVEAEKAVLTLL